MVAFIENPRRTPRLSILCDARVALRSGAFFTSCTLDLAPGGCGVAAAPCQLTHGERVFLEVASEGERHRFSGRVAWSSSAPPWRTGLAFDDASGAAAAALFERLAAAHPAASRSVDRIPEDAILARTPVPGTFRAVPRAAALLEAIGDGVAAGALRARLGAAWADHVNTVFALLERGAIEARDRGEPPPVEPRGWP